MKLVIFLCSVFSVTAAAAVNEESQAKILEYENSNNGSGNYTFSYETSNDIYRKETGYLKNAGREDEHIVVEGLYTYTAPDGNIIVVKYKADENGYQIIPPLSADQLNRIVGPNVVASLLGK